MSSSHSPTGSSHTCNRVLAMQFLAMGVFMPVLRCSHLIKHLVLGWFCTYYILSVGNTQLAAGCLHLAPDIPFLRLLAMKSLHASTKLLACLRLALDMPFKRHLACCLTLPSPFRLDLNADTVCIVPQSPLFCSPGCGGTHTMLLKAKASRTNGTYTQAAHRQPNLSTWIV